MAQGLLRTPHMTFGNPIRRVPAMRAAVHRHRSGFSLLELMVAVAMIGILAAMAAPAFDEWMDDANLKGQARSLADAFMLARSEAIRTGNAHIVFMSGPLPGTDTVGNALPADPSTNGIVPAIVVNDGLLAATNCNFNLAAVPPEVRHQVHGELGVGWGFGPSGGVRAPNDNAVGGPGFIADGASFVDQTGAQVSWVMFRPDGIPVTFTPACGLGPVGSGAGAVYLSNGRRDYAVVLSPLGGIRIHAWDGAQGAWRN